MNPSDEVQELTNFLKAKVTKTVSDCIPTFIIEFYSGKINSEKSNNIIVDPARTITVIERYTTKCDIAIGPENVINDPDVSKIFEKYNCKKQKFNDTYGFGYSCSFKKFKDQVKPELEKIGIHFTIISESEKNGYVPNFQVTEGTKRGRPAVQINERPMVIPKMNQKITFKPVMNKWGNYEDPTTHLIFDIESTKVFGVQNLKASSSDTGLSSVLPLNKKSMEVCKDKKFQYDEKMLQAKKDLENEAVEEDDAESEEDVEDDDEEDEDAESDEEDDDEEDEDAESEEEDDEDEEEDDEDEEDEDAESEEEDEE